MNRAWIPAGALAGVSVAGLIALGPLTDSLTPAVPFPQAVTVEATPSSGGARVVPVSLHIDLGTTGSTDTQSLRTRGGQATIQASAKVNGDAGAVGYRIPKAASTTSTHSSVAQTSTAKAKVKRQTSIGATAGPNGDSGIAGGSTGGSSATGGTKSTLGSDSPSP